MLSKIKELIKEIKNHWNEQQKQQKENIDLRSLFGTITYYSKLKGFFSDNDLSKEYFDGFIPYVLNKYSNKKKTIDEEKEEFKNFLFNYSPILDEINPTTNLLDFLKSCPEFKKELKSKLPALFTNIEPKVKINTEVDNYARKEMFRKNFKKIFDNEEKAKTSINEYFAEFINKLDKDQFYKVREEIENKWFDQSSAFKILNEYNIQPLLSSNDITLLLNEFEKTRNTYNENNKDYITKAKDMETLLVETNREIAIFLRNFATEKEKMTEHHRKDFPLDIGI